MAELQQKHKRHLSAAAHALRPIVIIGNAGLTKAIVAEIEAALDHHELVKIRVRAGDRNARSSIVEDICRRSGATLIQRIGHIATVYRHNPQQPRYRLP